MKIVLATDGSEFSRAAVAKCCELFGEKQDLQIKIVSVFEEDYALAAEPFAVSAELYREISEAAQRQSEHACTVAENLVRQQCGASQPQISHEVVKGNAEQEVVEIARTWGADLIIVGSHGRGFWGRLLGSVSDAVVHHAPCSVLVVRNGNNG